VPAIDQIKEQEVTPAPLFLFECVLTSGAVERWSTHTVAHEGQNYAGRLLRHNLLELWASAEEGLDGAAKIAVTLANADSHFSQIERATGFKGSRLTVRFLFYDLASGAAASEARVVFRGVGGDADEITESTLRVTFANRLNLQRIVLPEVRIQRRCPWLFPATEAQRQEALDGGVKGKYSPLYKCGYSAGLPGGAGNLHGAEPFTSCDYTRASCAERGMFALGRFGGVEFIPPQIQVRSHGEGGTHLSPLVDNQARYNDVVPIVYGTAWYEPPLVFARNDGNLTHMEILLSLGTIEDVGKVVVNDVEIPEAVDGADMTATGWYGLVTAGARSGAFNFDFTDGAGNPLGDPYGSMAMASVVVPNQISTGQSAPRVKVLVLGVRLERFDEQGASLGEAFTNNPAWVLLDVLRRSGWLLSEIDTASFAAAAAYCEEPIATTDLYGNNTLIPRFQCNLVVRHRRSAAEIVRGIRAACALMLTYGPDGRLALRVENTLARQQPEKPAGSNSVDPLNGGWPSYEFSDGSASFSGILRKPDGEPAIRLHSRSASDTPNRLTVEFQDEFNEYQQDSLSLVDVDDALATGREVTAAFPALGIPNFDQAARALDLQLRKFTEGNIFVELETSVRGVGLQPGDLITITYMKEGLVRQPFRVVRLVPGLNYQSVRVTAQWHDDAWYTAGGASAVGGRRRSGSDIGLPRPLVGSHVDENGVEQFGIVETLTTGADGRVLAALTVSFQPPAKPRPSGVQVPLVSLSPAIETAGGTLSGGATWYYAVSARDAAGDESGLSFAVRAKIPTGTNTNMIRLTGLSFSPGTASFNVYRGSSPAKMLRIAEGVEPAGTFLDTGLPPELKGPPDPNYDHANFYWRLELQPEVNVETHTATTIGNSGLGMTVDAWKDAVVRITRGRGAAQERRIAGNSATTLTVDPAWRVEPDASSHFVVAEGTWKLAGVVRERPAVIEAPGRPGAAIEISGRSANVLNRESVYELNPVTRWQIGSGGTGSDPGFPPAPSYTLAPGGNGTVEVSAIGFATLENTYSIQAATLALFSWNELGGATPYRLASGVGAAEATIALNAAGPAVSGTILQIGGEILEVIAPANGGAQYQVIRGAFGSVAGEHEAEAPIYHLERSITVLPFARGFFGTPASTTYVHSVFLPDVRVGAAEMYMSNSFGNGVVTKTAYGATADQGLRTLSGGQIAIQVEGYLAVQNNAAPAIVIDETHAARDISAVVREAPAGGPVEIRLRLDEADYCRLTIPAGETESNVVHGFGLNPLTAGARLNLDIIAVPGAANTLPGRDLTVTVRL
jgi:hypothetical protein